jgi:hypothetical protein
MRRRITRIKSRRVNVRRNTTLQSGKLEDGEVMEDKF